MPDDYTEALRSAPLSDQTRRTYASKVRQYLEWLAGADLERDPLADGRDWAVRDYRTHLFDSPQATPHDRQQHARRVRRLLHPPRPRTLAAARVEISAAARRALDKRAQLRYLHAVQACPSPRDQALALVPFYAGARVSEIVALDVDDIARSARKGALRIYGKGERVLKVPIHPRLHSALTGRLAQRPDWPGAPTARRCSSTNAGSD